MRKCLLATILLLLSPFFINSDAKAADIVSSSQRISDTEGGFTEILDDSDAFGVSVSGINDLNGDGVKDIVVGVPGDDDGGSSHGAAYILFLKTDGTVSSSQKISDTAGNFLETLDDGDNLGISASDIGDLNNDGITDLAIGAYLDDDGGLDRGAIYILFMNTNGTVSSSQKISDTEGSFTEVLDDNDQFGNSIDSIGDLNNDGVIDLAVGANGDDDGGSAYGAVYILFMNTDGTVSSSQKISATEGNFTETLDVSDCLGKSVANIDDLNNDGVTDLAVGAVGDDDGGASRGAIYILFMNTNGTVLSSQKISDTEGNFAGELDNSDYFGQSVSNIGDLDNDGITDLVVGAFGDDDGGSNHGAVHILYMNTNGTVSSHEKISDTYGNFTEVLDNWDWFGESSNGIGDLNNDGVVDIVVGARNDDDGGNNRGAVYILFLDNLAPTTSLNTFPNNITDNDLPSFSGTASDTSIITSIEFQIDSASDTWIACTADDGAFDETTEDFTCTLTDSLSFGEHTIYIRSTDILGNVTSSGSEFFYEFEVVEELSGTGSNILICLFLGIFVLLTTHKIRIWNQES